MLSKSPNPLILFAPLLLTCLVINAYGSSSSLIKSSCATTLYPHLCHSTLSTIPITTTPTTKDLIHFTIIKTKTTIQANLQTINHLATNATKRAKIALHDCLVLGAATLELIDTVAQELKAYPTKKPPRQHADDLITLMSTTITNKETCLDGLSLDAPSKLVRKLVFNGHDHVGKMCSNVLAMIKNMTESDTHTIDDGKIKMVTDEMWPEWLSAGDRKLLQSGTQTPNVTVAADGSGNYKTVAAAVAAAPSKSATRYVIKIKAGVYKENVNIPSGKTNLMFIGDGRSNTIITASESVAGGNTTFNSATVAAVGSGFLARDITFQNTAGPSGDQAVALRVGSDLSAFYQCGILAYQDTLYVHSNRQFFSKCMVAGTVDFIFGNAAVVLQDCDIQPRRPDPNQKNMVTAQGRTDPNQNTGIVIQKCRIAATSDLQPVQASFPTYLGRPWKEYSRTVVMQSAISDVINPAGWYPWNGDFALSTLYYREYQNTGAGADTSKRVTWPGWGVITTTAEAQSFTPGSFIAGGSWLQSTGFPYSLGLSNYYQNMQFLLLFVSLLTSLNLNHATSNSNIITSSCINTLYPDTCHTTLSDATQTIATIKDVIQLTLNKTKDTIQANFRTITDLTTTTNLTTRDKMALYDCLDMQAATLDQLDTVIEHLTDYPTKKPLRQYAEDLKTLMSTTITNKETCLDGLAASNRVRKLIVEGEELGGKMCSNVLAMIKNMTDTDIANSPEFNDRSSFGGRKLKGENKILWPEWLSVGDRKLLTFWGLLTPTVTVDMNGKGDFTTVMEAVDAAPHKSDKRFVIKINAGTYREQVLVARSKHNIMFVGDGRGKTIITGNKSVAGDEGTTTTTSATVGASGHQAVALRVGSDLSAFYSCDIEGYQDTLYVHTNRQFYVNCLITGTIDFIFGNAAVVFQFCEIMARKPNTNQDNMVTAQGRTDINQETGIVIQKCKIGATPDLKPVQANVSTYLGRPWKKFSRTVVMHSEIGEVIKEEGWHPWEGDFALDTLFYLEYKNTGPGSDTSKRVRWKGWGVIKDDNEANHFTVGSFINGLTWLLSTGFPFLPGL
ncbi:hypothetical protein E3N88_22503 [Mikania micrantha]|uniref:pectinesterase n=1 Tax=Mikania micrantha TaxID=192012 RepID=A0A5N6NAK0_9ASTR|nr:hypothetical protein E3N88_22503 [Mikania micrantha]